ncbi:MAG: hypothetical protein RLZZ59_296 [Pseudomonadota bacterium]|jgi:GTP-binding protein
MISIDNYRKLFKQEIDFVAGAMTIKSLPKFTFPQIAFVGKSNVGKSSLINAICNRKALARVSHTPGRTQQINFFSVGGRFLLVDLPGYGYAKVSHKRQNDWEKLITHYLFDRRPDLVNLLIDSRRGIKEHDEAVIDMIISNNIPIQIVFTKCDEIKDYEILKTNASNFFHQKYNIDIDIIFTSTRSKEGAQTLQNSFHKYITGTSR